jgi:hypothetical protein
MPKAIDLIREGKNKELWQMCCGFLSLSTDEFMAIQQRLLVQQLELLNHCAIGEKIMRGAKPKSLEEFREMTPLTTYKDYCPELLEKREDVLPARPEEWVHTSGRSGEYPCKWIPLTPEFLQEMSVISFGIAILSTSKDWGDTSRVVENPRIINAVAPRPYMSGAMAKMMGLQSSFNFMPPLEDMDKMTFEERIQFGFEQALSQGLDGFCGLSLILVKVGEKFGQASNKASVMPYLKRPRAALRLAGGLIKSKLAGRPMLPRDLWTVKGIISGGLDSWVYKDRIKELWGRYPLDVYAGSEGGVYATQTWDYAGMTFVPNLNFLEFIPEDELIKWEMDRSYKPRTLLLNEVKAGKEYEVVLTNFHGGAMVRYRPGDMIRITSLRNEKLGIELPQMVFARRADDIIDFGVIRLNEKVIWQAIENSGVPYEDWIANKEAGENMALHIYMELKDGSQISAADIASAVYNNIVADDDNQDTAAEIRSDFTNLIDFKIEVTLLPKGTFNSYIEQKRSEGADLAHLKPPHINPSEKTLTLLIAKPQKAPALSESDTDSERVVA